MLKNRSWSFVTLAACLILPYFLLQAPTSLAANGRQISNPFFYALQKDGKTTFLLGTLHMGVPLDSLPSYVRNAVANANSLTVETHQNSKAMDACVTLLLAKTMFRMNGKMSDDLSPKAWRLLTNALKQRHGLSPSVVNRLSPSAASILLGLDRSALKRGTLDNEIEEKFKRRGVPIHGLEHAVVQTNIMKNISTVADLENQLMILNENSKSGSKSQEQMYFDGDLAGFEGAYDQAFAENASWAKAALTDRNTAWIPKIRMLHAKPGLHFVAVGTLHLVGNTGLIKLLAAEGFAVTRVTSGSSYKQLASVE
jgi:uncharacterized protein YbaP (TraB family)